MSKKKQIPRANFLPCELPMNLQAKLPRVKEASHHLPMFWSSLFLFLSFFLVVLEIELRGLNQ
jgi:hypothetical protein